MNMENGEYDFTKKIEVYISSEKNKCTVDVAGDMDVSEAKEVFFLNFNDKIRFAVADCSITPSNFGYAMTVLGHKTLREYLVTKQCITCRDIFGFCQRVCYVFKCCENKGVFSDFMFDYNAVFVDSDISESVFMYVPYSSMDKSKIKFSELAEILYIYVDEQEIDVNETVRELISFIQRWEKSGYEPLLFNELDNFIHLCMESFGDRPKKDILLKNCLSKKNIETADVRRRETMQCQGIILLSGVTKKQYKYLRERNDDGGDENVIKIGRNKMWADMHISDMTVSGKHAVVVYKEKKFYIKQLSNVGKTSVNGIDVNYETSSLLLNGTVISFGRQDFKVKLHSYCSI